MCGRRVLLLMVGLRGETLVSELQDCIQHVRSEQTRINTHFENKYDALMEERNKANEEWMAERRRVNQVKMMRGGCPVYQDELCRGVLYRSMLSMLRE